MELIRVFPQVSGDLGPKLPRHLSALDSDHDLSARQVVKDVYESETPHSLAWEIKGPSEEHTKIAVALIHFYVVLLRETLELDSFYVIRRLQVLHG